MTQTEILLNHIAANTKGGSIRENSLFFDSIGLKVEAEVYGKKQAPNGSFSAEAEFRVVHPVFDVPVTEYAAGGGKDIESALMNAAESFSATVLADILATFGCTGGNTVKSTVTGEEILFRKSCIAPLLNMGAAPEGHNMWNFIKDDIPKFLGRKNAYWIKMYAARIGSDITAEATINNRISKDLTFLLEKYARDNLFKNEKMSLTEKIKNFSKKSKPCFISQKQFVLLLREPAAELPPSDPSRIADFTFSAIPVIMEEADPETAYGKIKDICEDDNLAWEILSFAPEIYACAVLNISQKADIDIIITAGGKDLRLKSSAITNYDYIEDGVYRFLREKSPDRDTNMKIIGGSAVFQAVYDAVLKGAKAEDLAVCLAFNAPEDYSL